MVERQAAYTLRITLLFWIGLPTDPRITKTPYGSLAAIYLRKSMLTTKSASALVKGKAQSPTRDSEIAKYDVAYKSRNYKMGRARMDHALQSLSGLTGSLLDVGCGRGEIVGAALDMGLDAYGVEPVEYLTDGDRIIHGYGWALPFPDDRFDHVTMFDVIEHLLPGDDEIVCRELARVAKQSIVLTANDRSHVVDGVELHINLRSYDEWEALFNKWFDGEVERLPRGQNISETWRITVGRV